jgi:hypothetical protein
MRTQSVLYVSRGTLFLAGGNTTWCDLKDRRFGEDDDDSMMPYSSERTIFATDVISSMDLSGPPNTWKWVNCASDSQTIPEMGFGGLGVVTCARGVVWYGGTDYTKEETKAALDVTISGQHLTTLDPLNGQPHVGYYCGTIVRH